MLMALQQVERIGRHLSTTRRRASRAPFLSGVAAISGLRGRNAFPARSIDNRELYRCNGARVRGLATRALYKYLWAVFSSCSLLPGSTRSISVERSPLPTIGNRRIVWRTAATSRASTSAGFQIRIFVR